eukprot:m.978768 g.978768  ORF g.978768 m.978768 type:complete len:112 (+) comp23961_c0_seq10:130-465(+)
MHVQSLTIVGGYLCMPVNPVRFGAGFVGDLTGPLFCVSTFLNIQGLMTSMLVLGRINCLPTGAVKSFVRNNNVTLHTLGWLLMPSVATLSMGIVSLPPPMHHPGDCLHIFL